MGAWRDVGVEIVKASMFYGRHLRGNAYKVLIAMSMTALDKPIQGRPASLYWGGWDSLAITLGYDDAARGSAGHNAVARAIRELRSANHVTPMVDAARGMRQSYLVHPGGFQKPEKGEQNAHAKGEQDAHAVREQNAHQSVSKTLTPRKDSGVTGLTQDTNLTVGAQPQTEAPTTAGHKFRGRPGDDCETCGRPSGDRRRHPVSLVYSEGA